MSNSAKPQECAGCGCDIDEGLAWRLPHEQGDAWQTVRLCCNKRCLARAQRRYDAQRSGALLPHRRKHQQPAPPQPIQPESSWDSLSHDVLAQLATHLPARDLLSAALTCRHWRSYLIRDVTHLEVRVDDVSCGCLVEGEEHEQPPRPWRSGTAATAAVAARRAREGTAADADCAFVRSAGRMLRQLRSLTLTVSSRCWGQDALLRHLHDLTAWTQLRHVRIDWDYYPERAAGDGGRGDGGGGGGVTEVWLDDRLVRQEESVLCALGLGALGQLKGLESLTVTGRFETERRSAGLFGLSSLERLTSLQLLAADTGFRWQLDNYQWSSRDSDLSALTRLQSLSLSAQLLSSELLCGLGAVTSLTRLAVADLGLDTFSGFYEEEGDHRMCRLGDVADQLQEIRSLRLLEVDIRRPRSDRSADDFNWGLGELLFGIRRLTEAQLQDQSALQQQQQHHHQQPEQHPQHPPPPPPQQQQPGGSRRRHRRHAAGAAGSPAAEHGDAAAAAAGPVRVELRFGRPCNAEQADAAAAEGEGDEGAVPEVILNDSLVNELVGLVGLSRLDLRFREGSAATLHRLSQLTNLTHLGLRCGPLCRPSLGPTDLQLLVLGLPALTSLVLELPAAALGPTALSAALGLAPCLRKVELHALPHVQKVPYDRRRVRTRLLRVAERPDGGGAAAAVTAAEPPLMFLQQLFMSMNLRGVRQALRAEAEWRQQNAAQQAEAAAAASAAAAAEAEAARRREAGVALAALNSRLQSRLQQVRMQRKEEDAQRAALKAEIMALRVATEATAPPPPLHLPAGATAAPPLHVPAGETAAPRMLVELEALAEGLQRLERQMRRGLELLKKLINFTPQFNALGAAQQQQHLRQQERLVELFQSTVQLLDRHFESDGGGGEQGGGGDGGGGDVNGPGADGERQQEDRELPEGTTATGLGSAEVEEEQEGGEQAPAASVETGVIADLAAAAAAAAAHALAAAAPGPAPAPALAAPGAADPAPAAAVATGAGGMPTLAVWVLRLVPDEEEEAAGQPPASAAGPSGDATTNAGARSVASDAGGGAAAAADAADARLSEAPPAPPAPPPPPVPLHELSLEQLGRLRSVLIREELVTGPLFRLEAWSPPRLEVLRLRGFAGVDFARAWAPRPAARGRSEAGGRGGGGGAAAAAALCSMSYLRVLDVVAMDEAAAAVTRAAAAEWAAPGGGCTPRLTEVTVEAAVEAAMAAAAADDDVDDDDDNDDDDDF